MDPKITKLLLTIRSDLKKDLGFVTSSLVMVNARKKVGIDGFDIDESKMMELIQSIGNQNEFTQGLKKNKAKEYLDSWKKLLN